MPFLAAGSAFPLRPRCGNVAVSQHVGNGSKILHGVAMQLCWKAFSYNRFPSVAPAKAQAAERDVYIIL